MRDIVRASPVTLRGTLRAMVTLEQFLPMAQTGPRIEILGVFGSGKTTLAKRLARPSAIALLEDHAQNPFWGDDAALQVTGYLPYDLHFLLQHVHLATGASRSEREPAAICDWSLISDRLWASRRLGNEFETYLKVYHSLAERVGEPVGYVYLRQSPSVIVERLLARGRLPEAGLLDSIAAAASDLDRLVATLPSGKFLVAGDDIDPDVFHDASRRWKE